MGALHPAALHDDRLELRPVADAERGLRERLARHGLPEALHRLLGQRVGSQREIVLLGAGPASATDEHSRNEAYRLAQEDPLVKELMRRFEADIISREPFPRSAFRERYGADSDTADRP